VVVGPGEPWTSFRRSSRASPWASPCRDPATVQRSYPQAKEMAVDRRPFTADPRTMAFLYILRCADDSLYVGSTTSLQHRLYQHQEGLGAAYTARRLPVELVYVEEHEHIGAASPVRNRSRTGAGPSGSRSSSNAGTTCTCSPASGEAFGRPVTSSRWSIRASPRAGRARRRALTLVEPGEPLGEPVSRPPHSAHRVSTPPRLAARRARPPRTREGYTSEPSSSSVPSESSSYLTYLMPASTSPSKPRTPFSRTSTRLQMLRTEPAAWLT